MIEEVLNEINAAEERAAQILAEARQSARDIALSIVSESEAVRAEFSEETKRLVKQITDTAQADAAKAAAASAKEAELAAQALVRNAEKNVRSVGEWLAEQLIKGKA